MYALASDPAMTGKWSQLVTVSVCAITLVPATSAGQGERQDRHRVPADFMSFQGAQWLERDERVAEEQPERVLDAMGLEAGDVVADVGCGSGYYARRMARRVMPGGTVYCEDIQPEMLDIMRQLAAEDGTTGINPVLGTATDPKLPEGALDWIIIADVYHEMSNPVPMLAGLRRALSPTGRVALLEYRVEDGTGDQIKADHTMSVRQVVVEWHAAGFELVALHDFLPGQHLFFFRAARGDPGALAVHDLFDAIDGGLVEAEATAAGADRVAVRIRRTGEDPVVVTSPVATYFAAGRGARDMVARRDGWIVLDEGGWHDWSLRALARQRDQAGPPHGTGLEIRPPTTVPKLEALFYAIQVGTYTVADSPTLYPPRTQAVEEAAVWITDGDADYVTVAPDVEGPRVPAPYAVAFALVFCDEAGIDVTRLRVWNDREEVFGVLRDQGLRAWYQIKTAGRVIR